MKSDKQSGVKYQNQIPGEKPGNFHEILVMKGRSDSNYPGQRVDYVKLNKEGQFYDISGNKVTSDSFEAHIPLKGNETIIENLIGKIWKQ